jgi:hypothetical protein
MKELGYSIDKITTSVKRLYKLLHNISPSFIYNRKGIIDFFELIFRDPGLIDWLRFKMESASQFTKNLYKRLKQRESQFEINIDCVTASFALISGTDFFKLREGCDYLNPKFYLDQSMWGWEGRIKEYVKMLGEWNNGLSENQVLDLVYRIFGLNALSEMKSLKVLIENPLPSKLIISEINKAVSLFGDASRIRPWITLDIDQEELRYLIRNIREGNLEGCLVRSYDRATEKKLNMLTEELYG